MIQVAEEQAASTAILFFTNGRSFSFHFFFG
jgi:hypothetical protein